MTVRLERAHAECLGQGQGLLVVGLGLHDIGGVGVRMDHAQLVQRERLVGALFVLPGQVERLVCVLPGLLAAPHQTTDLAEPCNIEGAVEQRAHADFFPDRLLQERTPLREAPLERRGRAQACRDQSQPDPVAGGTTEGQARSNTWMAAQVPLGEVQVAEAAGSTTGFALRPSSVARRSASPPRGAGPRRRPQARPRSAPAAPGIGSATKILIVADSRSAASMLCRSSSTARPKSPISWYASPRVKVVLYR